jgi:hypothetical protein
LFKKKHIKKAKRCTRKKGIVGCLEDLAEMDPAFKADLEELEMLIEEDHSQPKLGQLDQESKERVKQHSEGKGRLGDEDIGLLSNFTPGDTSGSLKLDLEPELAQMAV